MKKKYIIIGFVFFCFIEVGIFGIYKKASLDVLDNGLTLQEIEQFFVNTEKYKGEFGTYQAVDILKLWSKLNINPKRVSNYENKYLFGYNIGENEKFMDPETKLISKNNLKIMEIGTLVPGDYQYLFFKKQKDNWVYFDHIDLFNEKYQKPEINFLDDNLLSITLLSATGTDLIYYTYKYYRVADNKLIKLLTRPKEGEQHGWGMLFNREFNSTSSYKDGALKVVYKIKVTGNNYYYESKVDNEYQIFPLFNIKKEVVFNYNGEKLILDKAKSALSLEELENLFYGGYLDYYKMFKPLFKKLQKGTAMQKEWYEIFKGKIKQKMSNS